MALIFTIETEQETDGRWIAEVIEIPGAMVYGSTTKNAVANAQALALRVLAERLEHGEAAPTTSATPTAASGPGTVLRPPCSGAPSPDASTQPAGCPTGLSN